THVHKLAMVLAAAQRDELIITAEDLVTAEEAISDLEADMPKVFSRIGRSEFSIQAERFIKYMQQQGGEIPYEDAYRYVHLHFPDFKEFEGMLKGAIQSGQVRIINPVSDGKGFMLKAVKLN